MASRARIEAARARDGATTGALFNPRFDFRMDEDGMPRVTLGAKEARLVGQLLEGRLLHGNTLILNGQERTIVFEPSSTPAAAVDTNILTLRVTAEQVRALVARLEPIAGEHRLTDLVLSVERSEIRDQQGQVIRTIG
jgi:suppressor of fused-like protein